MQKSDRVFKISCQKFAGRILKQFWQLQFCVWKEVTGNIFKFGILLSEHGCAGGK